MSYIGKAIDAAALHESVGTSCDLWCAARSSRTPAPSAAGGPEAPDRAATPRVLIVEDEAMIAMGLESMIEDLGLEVCAIAATGLDAISLAGAHHPEIVLMDVSLIGHMDGVEAAQRIRDLVGARIVFVTAYGSGEVRERIQRAFPDAPVVSKPAMASALRHAIDRTGLKM